MEDETVLREEYERRSQESGDKREGTDRKIYTAGRAPGAKHSVPTVTFTQPIPHRWHNTAFRP